MTFAKYFGGGGGAAALGVEAFPILASRTLPAFTKGGRVQIAAMGGAGSGARVSGSPSGYGATGSNSSPWGVKIIDVAIGDVLEFVIAAGAAAKVTDGAGTAGGSTLVKLNGATIMTAQPGEPGAYGNAFPLNAPAPTATVVGADWVVPGLRAGAVVASVGGVTGGAAVDVFRTGLGRSTAVPGGSVGADGGPSVAAAPIPISSAELGVSILGVLASGYAGVGGDFSLGYAGGMFAGGGGNTSGDAGKGGRGAGGGGSYSHNGHSGAGGDGYAYIIFVPEE